LLLQIKNGAKMKRKKKIGEFIIYAGLLYFLLIQNWTLAYGKERLNFRENIVMPPEITNATTISAVQPFLANSETEEVKIAAIRRLGQIGDRESVKLLVKVFTEEPYEAGFESKPYVKIETIEAFQKIGGPEAKTALLDILNLYIKRGPQSKTYTWYDGDYSSVTPAAIRALYVWKSDSDVFSLFQKLAFDDKIRAWYVRQTAYEGYLKAKMAKEGIMTSEQSINYLTELLTGTGSGHGGDWIAGETGIKTLEALKNGAVLSIFYEYGSSVLPILKNMREKYVAPQNADEVGRSEALNQVIKYWEQKTAQSSK
jgi:hypothetical protein